MNKYLFRKNSIQRLFSAIFLIIISLFSIYYSGIILICFGSFLIFFITYEYVNITENINTVILKITKSLLNIIIFVLSTFSFKFAIIFYLIVSLLNLFQKNTSKNNIFYVLMGPIYLCLPFIFLYNIRLLNNGLDLLIWFLLIVWTTDSFSFYFGKLIGGKKLLLSLSPNKTWSGLLCGIIAGTLISIFCFYIKNYNLVDAFIYGLILSIFTQIGDLFESWIKRKHFIKDSGYLIPGHGGFLDRLDGLLISSIFLYIGHIYYGI